MISSAAVGERIGPVSPDELSIGVEPSGAPGNRHKKGPRVQRQDISRRTLLQGSGAAFAGLTVLHVAGRRTLSPATAETR